ncbi:MAG: enoyl-CoA hydratase/isomerase family protein [Edaphocola sp.]
MEANHPEGYVRTSIDQQGIGRVEFYHPSGNSLPAAILNDLAVAINDVGTDDRAKVIVLQSAGDRAFCGGPYFDELLQIETEEQGKKFFNGFALVINAMRKCHKFIIVRVQGKTVAGGVGLIAAADYAIATEASSIKLSELSIGIGPFVVGPVISRKIGVAGYSQLAIDSTEWRSAEWARRHGLYAEMHPTVAGMDESVNILAKKLTKVHPEAMIQLKKAFWEGTDNWDQLLPQRAAISGKLVLSEFTRNALHTFKQKV